MILNYKKAYIAYFLLAFLFAITLGSLGVLFFMRFHIKASVHTIINKIADHEFVVVEQAYSKDAEKKDEIVVNGGFYDVAKFEKKGNKIIYYCYYDEAETNLNSFFWGSLAPGERSGDQKVSYLFSISQIKYINQPIAFRFDCQARQMYYDQKSETLALIFPTVHTPPPQLL